MGGGDGRSGGLREFVAPLIRAAVATGVDGLFVECHRQPEKAPSDGASMVPLDEMERIVESAARLWEALRASS